MPDTGQIAGFLSALVVMHLIGNGNNAQSGNESFILGLPRLVKSISVDLIIVNQRKRPTNVTLKCPGVAELSYEVDTVRRITLPNDWLASNTGRDKKGITIATTYDVTIYCLYKNSTDVQTIFSVISVEDIKKPEYYVISPLSKGSVEDRVTLTALEPSTKVLLTHASGTPLSFVTDGIQYYTTSHTLVLDAQEAVTLIGNFSLDGVKISSSKPLAAVLQSKSENNTVSVEQLYPTALWGTRFYAPSIGNVDESMYESVFSITAITPTTVYIKDTRQSRHALSGGQTEDFSILWNETVFINATQPIMIKHYIRGTSTNISKQLWAFPPDDRNFYQFTFPSVNYVFGLKGPENFKVITSKDSKQGLLLDGSAMSCSWSEFGDQGASLCTQDVTLQKTVHTTLNRHNDVTSPQMTYTYAICDASELCTLPAQWGRVGKSCVISKMVVSNDGLDNDCDGFTDEELADGKDNDGDGMVDEDTRKNPSVKSKAPTSVRRPVYSTYNDDDDMVMRNFPSLVTAIIASLSAAVLLVIVCIMGFVIAECQCSNGTLRNSKILPFVG